jgi:transposase
VDRTRKNKASNKDWVNPHEADARVAKMKDGSTHLAHKVEHAVDMKTGAVLAVTLQGADQGDTATVEETLLQAGEHVAELLLTEAPEEKPEEKSQMYFQGVKELVTDKGYHCGDVLVEIRIRKSGPISQRKSRHSNEIGMARRTKQKRERNKRRFTRTGGELAERTGRACHGKEANSWNEASRTATRQVG